ncbi:hypothetical protein ILYODFUR_033081 [Ilyodon furcidens]|uniref:Uncharacterized protein n=1 Tax=Ilyodon furcidens TaxID=33524 RepID=A0ABV0TE89_9TELE
MVNGLHLYDALSSPHRHQSALHYNQSFTHPDGGKLHVATDALGQTDRDEPPLCPLTTSSVAQGQLRQTQQGFESATHRFQDEPLPLQPSSPCIKNDCVLYTLFLAVLRHGLEQLALHYRKLSLFLAFRKRCTCLGIEFRMLQIEKYAKHCLPFDI